MNHWDAIIVGGGHNGLVCAAYLAKAGKKVLVLERRGVLGGAAVTEEFHPGFRNSVASYTVSLLQPKVIDDLQLHAHDLRIINRPANNFLPLDDGRYLLSAPGRTQAEVAKFSERDAQRLPEYEARLEIFADVLRAWALRAPPDLGVAGGWRVLPALWQMGRLGRELATLDASLRQELLDLFTLSAAEYLDRWFESEPIKALFGFDGIVGNFASPYTPGSAYVLLHHVFGQCNGVKGAWGHAIGGMGAISQAMAAAAREAGAELRVDAGVRRVLVERFPERMADALLERIGAQGDLGNLPDKTLRQIGERLAGWSFIPSGTEGYAKAEVTVGGIATAGLSSRTMEAAKVPGLYAIGEAVDVTGWLGGYNFQWAWASGWAAGQAI